MGLYILDDTEIIRIAEIITKYKDLTSEDKDYPWLKFAIMLLRHTD